MKKSIFLCFLVFAVFGAVFSQTTTHKEEKGVMFFSAHIEHPNSDSVFISTDYPRKILKVFKLDKNNEVADTLMITRGFYDINDGTEFTKCYLVPGDSLHLTLDTRQFDETVRYSGKGACENNYLAQKFLYNESLGLKTYYGYWGKLDEKSFLQLNDSIYHLFSFLLDSFNKICSMDSEFFYVESHSILFTHYDHITSYPGLYRWLTGNKDYRPSDTFPDPFVNFDFNDERLVEADYYLILIDRYLADKAFEMKRNAVKEDSSLRKTLDPYLIYLNMADTLLKSPKIKEKILSDEFISFHFKNALNLDASYRKLKAMLHDTGNIAVLDSIYKGLKAMEPGTKAPEFSLYDIDSNLVTLSSLRGNLVYVDIWSTWCLPCLKEIEPMEKLMESYKGKKIKFVSICKNDDYERWKKTVRKNKLKGIQLFAPEENIAFFTHFLVNGVPRYLLIDADGKVISNDAPRPSWDKPIRELIDENLPE